MYFPDLSDTSSLSKILKTRSLAITPICKTLNLSAITLSGRNNKFKHKIKEVIIPPACAAFSVEMPACIPAHQTNKPTDNAETSSTTGKKTE